MGRKTWDDPNMPKPLPHRTNVVVTNREIDVPKVKTISGDITRELLLSQRVTQQQRVFVIGGAGLLNHTVGLLDTLHVTHVPGEFATDTKLDLRVFFRGWRAESGSVSHTARCTFITYHRV
jgi:dihydrofolate reductase